MEPLPAAPTLSIHIDAAPQRLRCGHTMPCSDDGQLLVVFLLCFQFRFSGGVLLVFVSFLLLSYCSLYGLIYHILF